MPDIGVVRLARWSAATMALAAGAVHLGQVRIHWYEDPLFGPFFLIVGALQVLGGVYLARPVGSPRLRRGALRFGIVGSLAVIAIWAVSRSFGLPFGAEPGEAEEVGLADMAANVLELFTALLLVAWLRNQDEGPASSWRRWGLVGAAAAGGLAFGWIVLRALGLFDPDPRLVLEPELTDAAALALLFFVASLFLGIALGVWEQAPRIAAVVALASLAAVEAPLVAFTLPGPGGQNLECRYAPLAEDSGHGTAEAVEPIEMEVGERRSVVVMFLLACADAPVQMVRAVPLPPPSDEVILITATGVDPARQYWSDRVRERPGPQAVPLAGVRLLPGGGRYPVIIEVGAVGPGDVDIAGFRVDYLYRDQPLSFGFATITSFCVAGPGHTGCEHHE
ncbi:MAG: hypothetical protein ACRDGT_05845 [Candidatus Limnocylindria bacterium]